MKIIFFCGSAEPGNDGVGDYSRRLCGELIRLGHEAQILSLYDLYNATYVFQNQEAEGVAVKVFRISHKNNNNQRLKISQKILNEFQPDWISLQFVPYSFNPKGLPFLLPSFLKKLKGNYQWQIMFHELWLGIDLESSFKHKCIGRLQQLIIEQLINKINPHIISTQNQLYQFILKSHNFDSSILPICSNIPCTAVKKEENRFTQFVLFGTIHTGAPFEDFVKDLVTNTNMYCKPLKFVFIGKNGAELITFTRILANFEIYYEVLGLQSEKVISQVLVDSDYGISTTPYFQTEKSGIYAAYKEHQLNSINVSRQWTPSKGFYFKPQIIRYEKNNLNLTPIGFNVFDLNSIAKQFINSISKI